MADLKSQLLKLFPHKQENFRGASHPEYSNLDVVGSYKVFMEQIAGTDFVDQRGKAISIMEENFPKLLNLKLKSNGRKAKASRVIRDLRAGTFDSEPYTVEKGRIRTLFWVPDVIQNHDAIYPNGSSVIDGEEVYLRHYDKLGSPIKLIFVKIGHAGERVLVTSFLTDPKNLRKYVTQNPLWPIKKEEEAE